MSWKAGDNHHAGCSRRLLEYDTQWSSSYGSDSLGVGLHVHGGLTLAGVSGLSWSLYGAPQAATLHRSKNA